MGILKQAVIVGFCLMVVSRISRLFEPNLPANFGGTWHPDFKKVVDIFRSNIENGIEPGAAFAVYYKGEPVIDVWGGYADKESQRPWTRDTTTLIFSCTKGLAAIMMARMVEKGVLDYSKPVYHYWPEFRQNDKENITVEMLISHQSGLPYLDETLSIFDYKNNRIKWQNVLAKQKTAWPAGTELGYHALTFGLYVDELIQRADTEGRHTAAIFREEIAEPFDIDVSMNLPLHEAHRTARIVPRTKFQLLFDALRYTRYLNAIKQIVLQPDSMMARSVSPVQELASRTENLNNPYIREVTVSSLSGTGTARGLAKLYGIISTGGSHDGKQLLSRETIEKLSTPVVTGSDIVMKTGEVSEIGLGTLYRTNPWGEVTVGHTGHGGQVAVGDLKNQLGISYITNHLTIHGIGDDPRFVFLETALYDVLRDFEKNPSFKRNV